MTKFPSAAMAAFTAAIIVLPSAACEPPQGISVPPAPSVPR